jgi:hypothetical protein
VTALDERLIAAHPPLERFASAGYYLDPITGQQLRSVTTILNQGAPKPALVPWAGNLTAETAMDNLPYLVAAAEGTEADYKRAYDWLRRAHTRKRDDRGDLGTAVHKLIEAEVLGEPVSQELLDDPEFAPYIARFQEFVQDFQVTFEASEMVVANYTHGYAGTLDNILRSPFINGGKPTLGDVKTGGELGVKGVYPDAGMQTAGYRNAEYGWLRDGRRIPMPETHGGVVLHLRPEGCWPVPVRCDEAVFGKFLHAKEVAEFTSQIAKTVVGKPLHPGGGHVLRPDGTCHHCPLKPKPARVPQPREPEPCDGSCEDPDACADCASGAISPPLDPGKAV